MRRSKPKKAKAAEVIAEATTKQLTDAEKAEQFANTKQTEIASEVPAEQKDEQREQTEQTAEPGAPKEKKSKTKKKKKSKKKLTEKEKTIRALRRLLTKIAVVGIVVFILLTWVGGLFVSHDNNMFPAVGDGDLAITYKLGGYYNGDIVVYEIDGINYFGRVVGIPGDTIDIVDEHGYYTINGTMPYETIYFATRKSPSSAINFPYTVQEGEVFIFNDMRENTYDSRELGGIVNLKGKVVLLIRRRGF